MLTPRIVILGALAATCAAAPPSYRVTFLGEAVQVGGMNNRGDVIGGTTAGGNTVAWVSLAGGPLEPLPLPEGMASSIATDINDAGEIVGAVSDTWSAYDFPYAVVWRPGPSGYEVAHLGRLPGHVRSMARTINNLGDIAGDSRSGMFRYPVLFTSDGVVDLSPTGIFDPADINDGRVLIAGSKRLDLDTMGVDDIGTPDPHYIATTGYEINERDDVAGAAIANSEHCISTPVRFIQGAGWHILARCSSWNVATGINDSGDTTMMVIPETLVYLEGDGIFSVQELIDPSQGEWAVQYFVGSDINNARQIATVATDLARDRTGAVLLTPIIPCRADMDGNGLLNVFDFLMFQTLFSNEDPRADLAAPFGVFNVFDFLAFQTAFGEGC